MEFLHKEGRRDHLSESETKIAFCNISVIFYSVDFVVEGFDVFLSSVLVVVSSGHSLSDLHGVC